MCYIFVRKKGTDQRVSQIAIGQTQSAIDRNSLTCNIATALHGGL